MTNAIKTGSRGVSRRVVLGGATVLAAAASFPRIVRARATQVLTVGEIEISVVSDGTITLPVPLSLPDTPGEDLDALFRAAGREPPAEFVNQTNVVLVRSGGSTMLVDAGAGPNFQATAGRLEDNLAGFGLSPADVDMVIFTHGHPDHLWGALDDFEDGARFENATHVIAPVEHDFWADPETADRVPDWAKGMALGSARVLAAIEDRLERRAPGEAIAPGLSFLSTSGHTPGHASVLVESNGESLLIGGDALTNDLISFQRPDWRLGTDLDGERAAATRRTLLDRLATERMPMIGFHLPWPGHGLVERDETAYRFVPLQD